MTTEEQQKTITMVVEGLSSKFMSAERARELMEMSQESFRTSLSVIRHMCDEQVQQEAQKQNWHTTFAVPSSLFGHDRYDQVRMGKCLAQTLYQDGFSVRGSPIQLEIIWGKKHTSRPLTQKTLEMYDAMLRKAKPKLS